MFSLEENHNKQLQVEISGLTREKDEAYEVAHGIESMMNHALHQAKYHEKDKCLEVLSQSHSRFNRLMEVSGCKTFRLGWEQVLLDPSAQVFSSSEEYDALNKV